MFSQVVPALLPISQRMLNACNEMPGQKGWELFQIYFHLVPIIWFLHEMTCFISQTRTEHDCNMAKYRHTHGTNTEIGPYLEAKGPQTHRRIKCASSRGTLSLEGKDRQVNQVQ